ncbi:MAG: hypothetical protein KAV99_01600 [Candidatus Latescibacteria bacterium]|nr:hypothetical protein [Candidatus Latescibacterota bacterium]
MTSRGRILTTFAHKQPDRCVTYIWINKDTMEQLVKYLGVSSAEEAERVLGIDKWKGIGLNIRYPEEYRKKINSLIPTQYRNNPEFYLTDEGRVVRIHQGSDYLEDAVWYPLQQVEKVEDLDVYPFPQEEWIEVPEGSAEEIRHCKEEGYIVSGGVAQPFKSAWLVRGMHNVLMDYLVNADLINEMYERIYSFSTAYCEKLVEAGVDMIQITGDLGMQDRLIMSPEIWREFDKERLKKMIAKLKGINPALKLYMHTDGNVQDIVEDLIEVGIDILNPIQPECMDPVKIKKKYGDRLVLHGAVSLQKTLPFGSPEDVKAEVRYLIENCNMDGGFVLGPSNVLFKEIPPENIEAMYEAVY